MCVCFLPNWEKLKWAISFYTAAKGVLETHKVKGHYIYTYCTVYIVMVGVV